MFVSINAKLLIAKLIDCIMYFLLIIIRHKDQYSEYLGKTEVHESLENERKDCVRICLCHTTLEALNQNPLERHLMAAVAV